MASGTIIQGVRWLRNASGRLTGYRNPMTDADENLAFGGAIAIGGDITIAAANASTYDGKTLEFTAAATVTLSAGLPADFGFAAIPPAAGNASIASAGGVLLNGATTTLTRAAADGVMFAVTQRASSGDSYVVTGS